MSAEQVMWVPKELDQDNRRAFADSVLALPLAPYTVVLDCSGTTYIDSSGLAILVTLSKKLRARGQRLVVRGLNLDLQTLFDLCRLTPLLCEPMNVDASRSAG